MRGTLQTDLHPRDNGRIIPAYAGNTVKSLYSHSPVADHPRVCGEHNIPNPKDNNIPGSSPRMRGTHMGENLNVLCMTDHPRVCGEHAFPWPAPAQFVGSSPRMRGTPVLVRLPQVLKRIIPAYAGNTFPAAVYSKKQADHPRVCGEHEKVQIRISNGAGSSPRMRGTLSLSSMPFICVRIIPAYAGNTSAKPPARQMCTDHPRVCGEHWSIMVHMVHGGGSSPRMRGTRLLALRGQGIDRIIPAYAGNTLAGQPLHSAGTDHPRVCGEHIPEMNRKGYVEGSSPRMRGTRWMRFC